MSICSHVVRTFAPLQTWPPGRRSRRAHHASADEAIDLPRFHGRQSMGATLRRSCQQHGKHRHAVPLSHGTDRVPCRARTPDQTPVRPAAQLNAPRHGQVCEVVKLTALLPMLCLERGTLAASGTGAKRRSISRRAKAYRSAVVYGTPAVALTICNLCLGHAVPRLG